jgi:hypothetical protein
MTAQQIHLFNCFYLAVLVTVALLTRATWRRVVGALAGGAAFGVVALGVAALGEEVGWWHLAIAWTPYFVTLLLVDCAIACAFIYLITWRIARRFGWRGLAAVVIVLAVIGPLRDYLRRTLFPEWGSYGPGVAPTLAIAAIYAMIVPVGQSVMRLVAGPARGSALARRPWEKRDARDIPAEAVVASSRPRG